MEQKISGRKPSYGFLDRLMYGVGEIFGGGCFVIINSFFIVFLTDALGMNAALAGTIPMIGKIWDAITDPIMGTVEIRRKAVLHPRGQHCLRHHLRDHVDQHSLLFGRHELCLLCGDVLPVQHRLHGAERAV